MTLIIFICSILALFYTFFGYPVAVAVLSSLFGKEVKKREYTPKVTLLISAYNEERVIREKIENSLKLDYPKESLEIAVASESTDKTNAIAGEYAPCGVALFAYEKREGKRATLYRTVPLVKGEIVVFSDANAFYKKDAIRKIVRNFSDERIGCVSGRLIYVNKKGSSIGRGESAYWEYDFILKKMLSRLFCLGGGVNGSIFAVRKALYDPIDRYRGDDFEISCRVEINGCGVVMEPEAVSNEEPSESPGHEFKRKVRLAAWNLRSALLLLKEAALRGRPLTVFILFSHRLLRYTTPLWLIMLYASNALLFNGRGRGGFIYFFLIQSAFYLTALAGLGLERLNHKAHSFFLMPFYFCMVNCAAFIGIGKNLFRGPEGLWEKTR